MIEIALGVLLLILAVAVLSGVGGLVPGASGIDILPLLGYGGLALLMASGVLLIAAGVTRRGIRRHPERRLALRTARTTATALIFVALLSIGLPLVAEPLSLVRLGGVPLGYLLAAQGALIGLTMLAFAWALRQNRIDATEGDRE